MTFLPIFGNLRKMCALDCGTITFVNEINHNSSIAKWIRGCPLQPKVVGSSPVAFHFFFLSYFVSLFIFILDFCDHGYIYLNLAYVYSTNTHVET